MRANIGPRGVAVPTLLWLGTRQASANGGTFPVINPATEQVLAEVADATSADTQ